MDGIGIVLGILVVAVGVILGIVGAQYFGGMLASRGVA